MRSPNGYVIITEPDVPTFEADTAQCVHCGAHWVVVTGSGTIRGYCYKCMGPFCGPKCEPCRPTEKLFEEIERKATRLMRLGV